MKLGRPDDAVVAIGGNGPLLWGEFRARAGGIAHRLAEHRGRPVVPWCRDTWDFALRLFGALAAGAEVVLPASLRDAEGLILDERFDASGGDPWDGVLPERNHLVFRTSGSTGQPKRVDRSLGQMAAEIAAIKGLWDQTPVWTEALATVSHQHVYGLAFALLWPLAAGRPFHARPFDLWEDVLAALPSGALLVTSPAHLTRMGGLPETAPGRRPAMVLSAGAPLPETAAREARALLGVPVTEIYGSTETGALAHRLRVGGDPPWTPLPGYGVSRTAEGLLTLDSPAARAELADRIILEPAGGFRLMGRADRIVKVEGKRVCLNEVEAALAQLPQVADAAALVVDGALAAVIVLSPQGIAERARLGDFRLGRALNNALAGCLEPAARPRRRRFVKALPQAHMGKRRNDDLAALFHPASRLPEILAERWAGDGSLQLDLKIPDDLFWFQGHFPGHPILPGVIQLDWVMHFARTRLGLAVPAAQAFQIKFKAVIGPGETLTLTLRHDATKGRLSFVYRRDETECASGTLLP